MLDVTAKQKQYATVKKGYVLLLNLSFASEEEEARLQDILDTVSFR